MRRKESYGLYTTGLARAGRGGEENVVQGDGVNQLILRDRPCKADRLWTAENERMERPEVRKVSATGDAHWKWQ